MTSDQLVYLVIGALITIGAQLLFYAIKRRLDAAYDDKIGIDKTLLPHWSEEVQKSVGCPGVLVTLVGTGKRPAHIEKVQLRLSVSGKVMVPLESGKSKELFSGSDNFVWALQLYPLPDPHDNNPVHLARDDAREYFLPIVWSPLGDLRTMPSEDVSIVVTLVGGKKRTIAQGLEVQEKIRILFEKFSPNNYSLAESLPLTFQLEGLQPRFRDPTTEV